ncbi:LysR family transcriptional regulator [Pleionea sediminis]|uniref:LysR family transcriptional regulator n=1 Tax=Pleionea sediminis TaxID=2569479 RepID=UPI001185749E|nr:LysR family transcriptional regulator [Pleionea sediminis]
MYNLDISLLRTFLDVNKTRHFGKTAENLYLTQSAVSARIKQLEDILGVPLFQRFRNNIQLTPQGERLVHHAELILNSWTQAVQDVSLPESVSQLVIGAPQSLWEAKLAILPIRLIESNNDLHTRTESLDSKSILRRIQERTLDIGFVFDPPKIDEVNSEHITTIELKLYSSSKMRSFNDVEENHYVMVDWGQGFSALHAKHLPQIRSPRLHANDWLMAVEYLNQVGGFAFLPTSLVESHQYELFPVEDAPSMEREVYMCFHRSLESRPGWDEIITSARKALT